MSALMTQLLFSGKFCELHYDTIPVKSASANVSFYTSNSKMPNFELWQYFSRGAICGTAEMTYNTVHSQYDRMKWDKTVTPWTLYIKFQSSVTKKSLYALIPSQSIVVIHVVFSCGHWEVGVKGHGMYTAHISAVYTLH